MKHSLISFKTLRITISLTCLLALNLQASTIQNNEEVGKNTNAVKAYQPPVDPLILILPSDLKPTSRSQYFSSQETTAPLCTETFPLNSKVDIYLICENPKFIECKLVVLNSAKQLVFSETIYPIKDYLGNIRYPKVTIALKDEGVHEITGQFFPKNLPPRTICNSILIAKEKVSNDANNQNTLASNAQTKDYKNSSKVPSDAELNEILTTLAYYPINSTRRSYSRQEVMTIIKNFFNPNFDNALEIEKEYKASELANITNSVGNSNQKDITRYVIQSLPLWKAIKNDKYSQPASQLAKKVGTASRPSDLALLADLLECEIPEESKAWGLEILSNSSNPKNTDILQALVMENYPESNNSDANSQRNASIQALTKIGSKKSMSFLLGLYGDLSTYESKKTIQFQKEIRKDLLTNMKKEKKLKDFLSSVIDQEDRWTPSSQILARQLLESFPKN